MRISKFLNIVILILLIIFLVTFISYGKDNCGKCKFEFGGDTLNAPHFMDLYSDTCLNNEVDMNVSIGIINNSS